MRNPSENQMSRDGLKRGPVLVSSNYTSQRREMKKEEPAKNHIYLRST